LTYLAYNLLAALAAIVAVPYDLIRGLRRGRPWSSLTQRLGFLPPSFQQTSADSIWLHAVSVGEVVSCEMLVRRLKEQHPGLPIFVSTGTATGQALAREKLGDITAGIFYMPLDLPFPVRRVLSTIRPRLMIVAETEIWPNLYRLVKRSGAGLLVVNGRISDRTFPSYQRFRFLFRSVLRHVDLILAQSEQDRERMVAIGAQPDRVEVGGNLKYDFEVAGTVAPEAVRLFLSEIEAGPVIVAGSTREGEELLMVEAFRGVAEQHEKALLVVAPRHPRRFDEAASALATAGLPVVRRSELDAGPRGLNLPAVLLLDSLGELAALYSLADVVFVGGSLNGWGGHNVLEPALSGRPVVVGPTTQNFAEMVKALLAEKGLIQIGEAEELGSTLLDLLKNRKAALAIGERGRSVAEAQRGATAKALGAGMRLYGDAVPLSIPGWGSRLLLGGPAKVWGAVARRKAATSVSGGRAAGRLRSFTICVGNLTAGGEGKTPVVAWIVEQLCERGHRPAVLTRGYRRRSSKPWIVVGPKDEPSAEQIGDEAYLLWRDFRECGLDVPIGVGADRSQAGTELEKRFPVDIVVMDDGYQHFGLERDFDLLVVDASRPFGGGRILPLGRLRESVAGASRAKAILLTKTQPGVSYDGIETELRRWNRTAPILRARTRAVAAVDASTGEESALESLVGTTCVGFCGLGNPDSFWRTLDAEGIRPAERLAFRDHHRYTQADIGRIGDAARRADASVLLTTQKDFVNLRGALVDTDGEATIFDERLQLFWLRIEQEVEPGLLDSLSTELPDPSDHVHSSRPAQIPAVGNI
jgi:3-deoxy-D-manno-octulosonic-acid transferase